jgi:tryptophanyl-tRNA synthetase
VSTDQGAVYILDDDDAIRKKFRSAVTDSGREIARGAGKAGITNLIEILAAIREVAPEAIEKEFAGASGYAGFKEEVGNAVADYLRPIRERYAELRPDVRALEEILAAGGERARAISSRTVARARDRMGVGPLD